MLVTSITPKGKTKTKIELDEEESFVLSNRDVDTYGIREGEELSQDIYETILSDLRKEALRKCGSLLKNGDYTSSRLYGKLVQSGFPEDIAGEAVRVMEDAHYVDDRRFAENYLNYHENDRSRMRIRIDLQNRGVPDQIIEEVFSKREEDSGGMEALEMEQIRTLMQKKHFDPAAASFEEKQKFKAFLQRRGYSMSTIREAVSTEFR